MLLLPEIVISFIEAELSSAISHKVVFYYIVLERWGDVNAFPMHTVP
jgi:hypothetical protein